MDIFERNCPLCGKKLKYSDKKHLMRAGGKTCRKCSANNRRPEKLFFRNCPVCKKQISYSSKHAVDIAHKRQSFCFPCATKDRIAHETPELKKKRNGAISIAITGDKNPFYGHHHSDATKDKLRKTDRSCAQTADFKRKCVRRGVANGMFGKSVFSVWEKKYGVETALHKMANLKERASLASSGVNNPMYGKPSPRGSGGGWGGWYKGWYFRSLKELSYMVSEIEGRGRSWSRGETKALRMLYVDEFGHQRTYTADFLVDEKYLIEVKPKELMNTSANRLKMAAGLEFCKRMGYEYQMVDVKTLDKTEIMRLYNDGEIKFIDKYKARIAGIIGKSNPPKA